MTNNEQNSQTPEQDKAQGVVELPARMPKPEPKEMPTDSDAIKYHVWKENNRVHDAIQPLFDRVQGENEELRDENEALSRWRELALQFDNHRMQALWHLKALLQSQEHVSAAHDFLDSPPLAAHEIVAERDALRAENLSLRLQVETINKDRDAEQAMKAKARAQRDKQTSEAKALRAEVDRLKLEEMPRHSRRLIEDLRARVAVLEGFLQLLKKNRWNTTAELQHEIDTALNPPAEGEPE